MWKELIIFFIITQLVSSCNDSHQVQTNSVKYSINLNDSAIKSAEGKDFYELVESVRFIPLETNQDCIIGRIQQVRVVGDQIIILNRANADVNALIFDQLGRFVRKVGRKGNGPEEFTDAVDIDIDPDSKDLYILADNQKKVVQYSNYGLFKKAIHLDYDSLKVNPARFVISSTGAIITSCLGRDCNLAIFDQHGTLQNHFFPTRLHFIGNIFALSKCQDHILYHYLYNDTVYLLQSGHPVPYIFLDFAEMSFDQDDRDREYFRKDMVFEGEDFIYVGFAGKGRYCTIIDKVSGKNEIFKWSQPGILGCSYPFIIFISNKGELGALQMPYKMADDYNELIKSPPPGFTFETEISNQLDPEDNPVVMIIVLK